MKASYPSGHSVSRIGTAPIPTDQAMLAAGRDFTTLDGRLIPRALGEAALRQRTAMLIGGLLIGNWPDMI